ncbi:protein bunched, class 2/F/G isoform-like isoform X2 [Limulus polyphemus]|uniref:Protein bunched, class 2/F/G isoform-like isoform X2 n=1 Tax=Limulus polyphemus TaxID=6850 RepID=A0ABM1THP5_LIMPO|nr:protein bunched, class 2/F/G isoform-like isoform X2 [Limulus polyphemus]
MAEKIRGDAVSNEESRTLTDRSTSATIYIDANHKDRGQLSAAAGEYQIHKKKPTSFQITSVTVQGSPRLSNDAGEDSADDLDESHTEDIHSDGQDSSRFTELENDQLSEDSMINSNSNSNISDRSKVSQAGPGTETISSPSIPAKFENVVETTSNVNIIATTSDSKVGVDIPLNVCNSSDFVGNVIDPDGQNVTLSFVTSCTTSKSTCTVSGQMPMTSLPDQWQNRFKVVKLVSSEPFKRGRWVCMDFTNPPAVQADVSKQELSTDQGSASGASSAGSSATSVVSESQPLDTVTQVHEIPVSQPYSATGSILAATDTPHSSQSVYEIYLPMNNQISSAQQVPQMSMVQNFGIKAGQSVVVDPQQTFLPQQSQTMINASQSQTSQLQSQHQIQPGQTVSAIPQPPTQPIVQVSETLPQPVVSQQHPTPPSQPTSGLHTQSMGNIPDASQSQLSQTVCSQDQNYQVPSQINKASTSSDVSAPNVITTGTASVPPLSKALPDTLTLGSAGDGEEAERI